MTTIQMPRPARGAATGVPTATLTPFCANRTQAVILHDCEVQLDMIDLPQLDGSQGAEQSVLRRIDPVDLDTSRFIF